MVHWTNWLSDIFKLNKQQWYSACPSYQTASSYISVAVIAQDSSLLSNINSFIIHKVHIFHGSNLEQVNHFSKWEAWVHKDQLGLRGCTLDSLNSNFHKIAISYSWIKADRVRLAGKKQSVVLDTDSDVKLPNSRLLHFPDIGTWHEQVKAHFNGISSFLRITWITTEKPDFFKKSRHIYRLTTQRRQQRHTTQASIQQKYLQGQSDDFRTVITAFSSSAPADLPAVIKQLIITSEQAFYFPQ